MNSKLIQLFSSRKFEYILLTVILLSGFVVRLYKINNPVADWHSWRQADTASVSRIFVEKGVSLLFPRYYDLGSTQSGRFNPQGYRYVEFPFYNVLNTVLYKSYPTFSLEVWARLISIFAATITGFFLYLIGKRYLGGWGGIFSAFFYVFIPYNIYFTRVILPDPFGVMLGVAALWLFIKFIDSGFDRYFYFSAAAFSASLLVKPFFVFYLTPVVYLAIKKFGLRNILKERNLRIKLITFSAIIFGPLLLWRLWEARHPEGIPLNSWMFNADGIRFRPAFWRWIFGERLGRLILGGWGLILFAFGVLRTKLKDQFINFNLLGMLLYVTVVAAANVRHDYYQIITIPAISLALAAGVVYLWRNDVFNKIVSRALVVFSVYMMLTTCWLQIRDNYNINHPEIIAAGKELDKIVPKDALVIAPYSGDTAFLYQTHRWGWPVVDDSIDNLIAKGASYYVSVDLGSEDTKIFASRFKTVEKTDKYIILNLRQPIK